MIIRDRSLVNEDQLRKVLHDDDFSRLKIRSNFIPEESLILEKEDNDGFFDKVQKSILEYAKELPHRQLVLRMKKNEESKEVEIIINPVTGSA